MKTYLISAAYNYLNSSKLSKMEDSDKFKAIKAIRALKPTVTAFEEFVKDARDKLKGEDSAGMEKKAQQWQDEGENTTLSVDERKEINEYFNNYNKKVEDCVKEESEKEVELSFDKLAEDAFGKFLASNDFDVKTILLLQDVLM